MEEYGFFRRLKEGLSRTRRGLAQKLEAVFQRPEWDEETISAMEETLITADVGVRATQKLLDAMRREPPKSGPNSAEGLSHRLQQEIIRLLMKPKAGSRVSLRYSGQPWVMMFVGVNGVGKTTTIGKLADQLRRDEKSVLLVAADTFRAGAIDQLELWGHRAGAGVIKHQQGQDPSGVVFDAIQSAIKRSADVVLIDTAGRLHTKAGLLEELKKMWRVIGRELPGAPQETLLVLDATTGQNGLQQAKVFQESLGVTGIVLTKLDGTAKGGVIVAIHEELGIPVEYVGIGEGLDDLVPFDPTRFVEALFA